MPRFTDLLLDLQEYLILRNLKKRCFDCNEVCKAKVCLVLGHCGPDEYFSMNRKGNCPWYQRIWWKFWRPK